MFRLLTRYRLVAGLVVGALVVLLAVVTILLTRDDPPVEQPPPEPAVEQQPEETDDPDEAAVPEPARLPLTGMLVDDLPQRPALIVKVSNSPEARPQSGLAEADLVIEELTEGGITRFMAVFHSQLPEVAGPVRSARPVDVQLFSGFGRPGFAYSGARDEVRDLLSRAPAVLITEGGPGFFRDRGAHASHPFAPHNLFVEVEPALAGAAADGAQPLTDLGWAFNEDPPSVPEGGEGSDGTSIEIAMSAAYRTSWSYDQPTGLYRRSQNGSAFEVAGGPRVGAANVVVLEVTHYIGASGYPETSVLGEGAAVVLRDGQRYPARWSKPSEIAPLRILDADGREPFPLKPGPTWLHLPDHLPD